MRKLVVLNMVSLDGKLAASNGSLSWHRIDEAYNAYAQETLSTADTHLYGRKTYETMVNYWPTARARQDDPIIAEHMNAAQKIVFSRSLPEVSWSETTLYRDNVQDEVRRLKERPGRDILILGSGSIVSALLPSGLIDELRLGIVPVVLGAGAPLFQQLEQTVSFQRVKTQIFATGVVGITYQKA